MEQKVYQGLKAFIEAQTTIVKCFQGWINRSAQPNEDFATMSFLNYERVGTNIKEVNESTEEISTIELITATVQLDFYGDNAYNNAVKIQTLLRDDIGCDFLENYDFTPIGCSQVRNLAGATIQQDQYKNRYGFDVEISTYEGIITSSEFFEEVIINKIKEVQTNGYIG